MEKLRNQNIVAMVNAVLMLPITVMMDRFFNIQQRVTSRYYEETNGKGEEVESEVKLMAKQVRNGCRVGPYLACIRCTPALAQTQWSEVCQSSAVDHMCS